MFASVANNLFAQSKVFTVYDTIPIRRGTNKYRLYKLIDKWFESERGTKLLGKNRKELQFKGKGYFIYYNRVKIPDIFLSPHANDRCKGSVVFTIDIKIQDSIIVSKFTNFVHEAYYSEYGSMTFGKLMDYDKVPPGTCMEVEEWCNAVWADMKIKSTQEIKNRTSRMIPAILIRRRTYKAKEEEVKMVEEKKVDPQEYLKLENYLIKEDKSEIREEEKLEKEEEKKEKSESEENISKEPEQPKTEEPKDVKTENPPVEEPSEESKPAKKSKEKKKEVEPEEQNEKEEPAKEKEPKKTKEKKSKTDDEEAEDEYDDY